MLQPPSMQFAKAHCDPDVYLAAYLTAASFTTAVLLTMQSSLLTDGHMSLQWTVCTVCTGSYKMEVIGGYRRGKELTSDVDFVATFERCVLTSLPICSLYSQIVVSFEQRTVVYGTCTYMV